MARLKNISAGTLSVLDVGIEIPLNGVIEIKEISIDDYRSSLDIPNLITSGDLVVIDNNNNQLNTLNSQNFISDNQGIDLSLFYKISEIDSLLNNIRVSVLNKVNNIYELPLHSLISSRLTFATNNPDSISFYSGLGRSHYVNQQVTTVQDVISVTGKGVFSGMILPRLRINTATNRTVTVTLIIDGVTSTETINYHNTNSASYRLFYGGLRFSRQPSFYSRENQRNATTDKRPSHIGSMTSASVAYVLHENQLKSFPFYPRIHFENSLEIKIQTNVSNVYSTVSYRNRIIPFYNMDLS